MGLSIWLNVNCTLLVNFMVDVINFSMTNKLASAITVVYETQRLTKWSSHLTSFSCFIANLEHRFTYWFRKIENLIWWQSGISAINGNENNCFGFIMSKNIAEFIRSTFKILTIHCSKFQFLKILLKLIIICKSFDKNIFWTKDCLLR